MTWIVCAHRALLPAYYPVAACFKFSIRAQSGATSPLLNLGPAVLRTWAFGRSKWRPCPAMSWPAGEARRDSRRTSDTSRRPLRDA